MAAHAAEPRERRRVAVQHGDQAGVTVERGQQVLDVAARLQVALLARALGGMPTRTEPVGGGHRQHADVAAVLGDEAGGGDSLPGHHPLRSEEHTSELQSLMRISYAVFCLKKKTAKT